MFDSQTLVQIPYTKPKLTLRLLGKISQVHLHVQISVRTCTATRAIVVEFDSVCILIPEC